MSPLFWRVTIASFLWVASILAFSLLYWFSWTSRPDSFLLNKEFNLIPYEQLVSNLARPPFNSRWSSIDISSLEIGFELDAFARLVAELDGEAVALQRQLNDLTNEQEKLETASRTVYEAHSERLWSNVEKYKKEAIKTEIEAVDRASMVVESLAQKDQKNPSLTTAIALANANVQLAEARYALALRAATAGEYVLSHLLEFADPDSIAQIKSIEEKLSEARKKQLDLIASLERVKSEAYSRLSA